jgi:hypothetical protein
MKTKIFAATVAAATVFALSAHAQNWSAAAAQDLQAIHDNLRDNSPAAVAGRDDAQFKAWLDAGLAQTKALPLNKINNAAAYGYALRAYTGGFRDANIDAVPNFDAPPPWFAIDWPGFSFAWKNNSYVVAWSNPADNKLPPVGAKLISCDKVPAETLAQQRLDRYEGNLKLEGDRIKTAPYLLWNRANPFIESLFNKCDFDVAGRKRTFTFNPLPGGEDLRRQAYMAGAPRPAGIGIEQAGGGWWIHLNSFADNQKWDALITQIETSRDAIHAAPFVVIDMRGADAGNAVNGYRVANWIWDPEYILTNRPPTANMAYRVSPANIKFFQDVLARLQGDDKYFNIRPQYEALVAGMNASAAAGQPLFQRDETAPKVGDAPANPVKGKVIVLTDAWCASACLDMMDLFTRLPNVMQAGGPTSISSIFVGPEDVTLPSNLGRLTFGNKAWLDRARGSTQPFTPAAAATYSGPGDDASVKAWVAGLVH